MRLDPIIVKMLHISVKMLHIGVKLLHIIIHNTRYNIADYSLICLGLNVNFILCVTSVRFCLVIFMHNMFTLMCNML
jgi:hypothetical protein